MGCGLHCLRIPSTVYDFVVLIETLPPDEAKRRHYNGLAKFRP
jgi:hypothetical protein